MATPPLPEQALARIRHASLARLQDWFERGITAQSLAAMFVDQP